jgi:hypothetical protein
VELNSQARIEYQLADVYQHTILAEQHHQFSQNLANSQERHQLAR